MSNTINMNMPDMGTQRRIAGYFALDKTQSFAEAEKLDKLTEADQRALATLIQQGNQKAIDLWNRFNCLSSLDTAAV